MFKVFLLCLFYFIGNTYTYLYDISHATMAWHPSGILSPQNQQQAIGPNMMPKRSRPEVKLYNESMCPACRAFDSSIFSQIVSSLGPYLDIITYPYGKATTIMRPDGSLDFVCQHGPNECYGNKLHACALDEIQPRDQALQFNACMMRPERPGNGSNDASAEECGALLRVNANAVKQCAKGQRGDILLRSYGEQTGLVDLQFVPHVEINGQFWRGQYENFMKDVCAAFTNQPAVCSGIF